MQLGSVGENIPSMRTWTTHFDSRKAFGRFRRLAKLLLRRQAAFRARVSSEPMTRGNDGRWSNGGSQGGFKGKGSQGRQDQGGFHRGVTDGRQPRHGMRQGPSRRLPSVRSSLASPVTFRGQGQALVIQVNGFPKHGKPKPKALATLVREQEASRSSSRRICREPQPADIRINVFKTLEA